MGHFSLMERGKFILRSDSNEKCKGAKPRHLFFQWTPPMPSRSEGNPEFSLAARVLREV
jgi:hypothetical protein